jgi:hypothetical protein
VWDWFCAHRGATAGVVLMVTVAAGAVVARVSSPDTASSTAASPSVLTAAEPDGDGSVPAPALSSPPPTVPSLGAAGDVELPLDPSAARGDHSEAGARQAAVDYLATVRQRLVYLDATASRDVLAAWAAPGVSPQVIDHDVSEAAAIRHRLAADGGAVWWVVSPLAVRLDAYSPQRARVAVWLVTVVASGADPAVSTEATAPMVRFQVDTVELVWAAGRWTVWSTTSVDGPAPMIAPSLIVATNDLFLSSLDGFGLIRSHRG